MADVLAKEASMAHKVEGEGLGRQVLGVPEFYVSHSWSANFHTLVGSLHTHFTVMGRWVGEWEGTNGWIVFLYG